jgi:hypothetical protein
MRDLEELLSRLGGFGFETIHSEPGQAVIRSRETAVAFILTIVDEWAQASLTVLEGDAVYASNHATALAVLAMRIHQRLLGCRFAFDDDGAVVANYDIYPDAGVDHISFALGQLAYVASTVQPLFDAALETGAIASEEVIDDVFRSSS